MHAVREDRGEITTQLSEPTRNILLIFVMGCDILCIFNGAIYGEEGETFIGTVERASDRRTD